VGWRYASESNGIDLNDIFGLRCDLVQMGGQAIYNGQGGFAVSNLAGDHPWDLTDKHSPTTDST